MFRWLGLNFPTGEALVEDVQDEYVDAADRPKATGTERVVPIRGGSANEPRRLTLGGQEDAPPCLNCGTIMVRTGACFGCPSCGESGGCG